MRKTIEEEFRVAGGEVMQTVKRLLREGNVRRISIRNAGGKTLVDIPLTIGVLGAAVMPVWIGAGLLIAVATGYSIHVERVSEERSDEPPEPPRPAAH
jgi:hypothetical protein